MRMIDSNSMKNDFASIKHIFSEADRNGLKFEAFRSYLSAAQYEGMYQEVDSLSLPREAKVLDWGCGDGHFSDLPRLLRTGG
ncbi:MAG TPA: hypothetical protein VJ385_20870 [Fibrobacteria bacterium]|nr:hypothetical protein [Fibrobacteria bacterium]